MSTHITVPSLGESITKGVLVAWLKTDGEPVKEGEDLFELETEKSTIAFPAPAAGILHIDVAEGEEVEIGQQVGTLEAASAETVGKTVPPRDTNATSDRPDAGEEDSGGADFADDTGSALALSPAVRRIVNEAGLDPTAITGTGKHGRITPQDAAKVVAQLRKLGKGGGGGPRTAPPAEQKTPLDGRARRREPMTAIRRATAERLVQAKRSTAYLTTFNEIDMQKVIEIRSHYKQQFEEEHGIRIGFMSFFVKAACLALKAYPRINSMVDGEDIVYQDFYDIGIAISLDSGLIVPVVRDADRKSFAEIEKTIASFAQRAKARKLMPDELSGGTFTITNGGVFGSMLSTPIPAYPQTAILGMHAIKKRPVVVNDQVAIRPVMYVALTYDHRVIDGREAIGFLHRIKDFIEEPDKLLLQM